MGWIKTRPNILLFAPQTITAGGSFVVRVVLQCEALVPVDGVSVELTCCGVWYTSSQHGRQRNDRTVLRMVGKPLKERALLEPGEHEYRVALTVPTDAPATYSGGYLSIEWEFRVRADIPWWPDAKSTFVAHVGPRPLAGGTSPPRVFASNVEGPQGTKPYAEVSLGEAVSGLALDGSVALSNTDFNDYRALELRLVSRETTPGFLGPTTAEHVRTRWTIPVSSPGENEIVRFRLQLPQLVPAFETWEFGLAWALEIRLSLGWAIDTKLWIPLPVRTPAAGDDTEVAAPVAVGSDRLADIWRAAGRRSGFNERDGQLTRDCGVARLTVRREHRGRRGLQLVAEARYPNLDLGLRVDGGRLRARDEAQAAVLASQTDHVLVEVPLHGADDERLTCVLDDAGARIDPVAALAQHIYTLWEAVERAREQMPAPADMADAVPAFRAAAQRLGGELDVASMDIRGSRYEIPFALEVQWDGDALARTVLTVCPTAAIDGRWHQSVGADAAPGPMPEGLEPLLVGVRSVTIEASTIRLVFPPCGANVQPMVERVEALLEVARRLSGQRMGYR